MDCKHSEKLIADFLNYSLSGDDLKCFINHIEKCPDCMEELGTSYLLNEALSRIEEGESVKLDEELKSKIEAAKVSYGINLFFGNAFRSLEVIAGIVLSFLIVNSFVEYVLPIIGM